jgi:hypothetical protein
LKKLLINSLLFSSPLLICLLFFAFDDPFGIFYKDKGLAEPSEDVIKIREFLNETPDQYHQAFIFGNSRTHAFRDVDWKKFIGNENVFHFGSPGESLLNIRRKMEMILDRQPMKHALILLDAGILENTDNTHRTYQGPVYNHSPKTSDISYFDFYANYIKYYFDDYFFAKHIYYFFTSNYKSEWMKNAFAEPKPKVDAFKSHVYDCLADSLIETDFNEYKRVFNPDYSLTSRNVDRVAPEDSLHLVEIRRLLEKNNVEYRIFVPPDFSCEKLNGNISMTLKKIMGNKFYDFTGKNRIATDSTLNYENLHFTYRAAQMMLSDMYEHDKKTVLFR